MAASWGVDDHIFIDRGKLFCRILMLSGMITISDQYLTCYCERLLAIASLVNLIMPFFDDRLISHAIGYLFQHIRNQDAYVARKVGSPWRMAGSATMQAPMFLFP